MSDFHGLPCWYELATSDLNGAQAFYAAILGWVITDSNTPGISYLLARANGAMVAGLMPAVPPQPVAWQTYFAVDDCDATATLAKALGAQIRVPPSDIPNTGRFAVLVDLQGAIFAILQPLPMETPAAAQPFNQQKSGHGKWHEIICPDPQAALNFYGKLFGWTMTRSMPMGPDKAYHIFDRGDGIDIGGACALPGPPHWKPYFAVPSAKAAVKAVTAAGGHVVHGPNKVPGNAFALQIKDPQGATLALVGGPQDAANAPNCQGQAGKARLVRPATGTARYLHGKTFKVKLVRRACQHA